MKKLALVVILCFTFSTHVMAVNPGVKLKPNNHEAVIKKIEKEINTFRAERKKLKEIEKKILKDGRLSVVEKEERALDDKVRSLELSSDYHTVSYLKALLERKEHELKKQILCNAWYKHCIDVCRINLKIDKVNIELANAKIKAGKIPESHLKFAEFYLKHRILQLDVLESIVRSSSARIKEINAYIRYLKSQIEKTNMLEEVKKEIEKNAGSNSGYFYDNPCNRNRLNANAKVAELRNKEAVLRLELRYAQAERKLEEIKEAHAKINLGRSQYKISKTFLKFNQCK